MHALSTMMYVPEHPKLRSILNGIPYNTKIVLLLYSDISDLEYCCPGTRWT